MEFIENLLFKTIGNVTSQTSHLTFFITEEKRKNYLSKKKKKKIGNKKLNHIISHGIL